MARDSQAITTARPKPTRRRSTTRASGHRRPPTTAVDAPWKVAAAALSVAVVVAVVFHAVTGFQFLSWDDRMNFTANPYLNADPPRIGVFWTQIYTDTYRPMIFTAWGLVALFARLPRAVTDSVLGSYSLDPHVFHTFNLLLHAVNAALVFLLLRRWLSTRTDTSSASIPSIAGALVFGLHPVQCEAVAWATAGNELLFGFFALIALMAYTACARPEGRFTGSAAYAVATAAYIAAILTKPTAVALPLVAWAVDRWVLGRDWRASIRSLGLWIAIVPVWVALTFLVRHNEGVAPHPPLLLRFVVAGNAVAFWLWKLIWPTGLTIDYGRTPAVVLGRSSSYYLFLIPVILGVGVWLIRRRRPVLTASYAIFIAALLPVMGFVPNTFQVYSTESDRYLYLPMLGVALAVGAVVRASMRTRWANVVVGAAGVLVIVYAALCLRHLPDYRDDLTLYRQVLSINPRSWMAHNNLSLEYDKLGRPADAAVESARAIALKPNQPNLMGNLAHQLSEAGRFSDSADEYARAFALAPARVDFEKNEGFALYQANRSADAIPLMQDVVRRTPNDLDAYDKLGACLVAQKRLDDAADVWRKALAVDADDVNGHYNLGAVLLMQGRVPDSIAEFQSALKIDPNNARAQAGLAQAQRALGGR